MSSFSAVNQPDLRGTTSIDAYKCTYYVLHTIYNVYIYNVLYVYSNIVIVATRFTARTKVLVACAGDLLATLPSRLQKVEWWSSRVSSCGRTPWVALQRR